MRNREEAMAAVEKAFAGAPRPQDFIRGTCRCEECLEHNQTMADHTPATITLAELGNPGWDPICFANEQAFIYYLPAMIRLVFEYPFYLDQLLFHLNCPDRPGPLTPQQAEAVVQALRTLLEVEGQVVGEFLDEAYWEQAIKKLEQLVASYPESDGGIQGR